MDAKQLGIAITAEAQVPANIAVDEVHLASIYANLLDNALHACEVLPKDERWLKVESAVRWGGLFIKIENSRSPANVSVPAPKGHGIGLIIIEEAVAYYKGTMVVEKPDGRYDVSVFLPLSR